MKIDFYIADVFTRQAFNGAQVAVFPDGSGIGSETMQKIAQELSLPNAVFVEPASSDSSSWKVRVFTPTHEVDLVGQAIVAAGYALASSEKVTLENQFTPLTFSGRDVDVSVNITGDKGNPEFVQFSSRSTSIIDRFTPTENEIADVLSLEAKVIDTKQFRTRLVSCGTPFLIVPMTRYEAVRKALFNYQAWSQSTAPQTAAQEILLFSRNPEKTDVDFHLRLVGPGVGLNEDPPVGGALQAFAAYLCSHEHVQKGTYAFAVDRGSDECRRSVLNLEMDNRGQSSLTLRVGGEAVITGKGQIDLT